MVPMGEGEGNVNRFRIYTFIHYYYNKILLDRHKN